MTPGQKKMGEYAATVADHPYYRALLDCDDKRHALHNAVLAGMDAVYGGCLPSDEREMIRRLDAKIAFVRNMKG